MRPETWMTMTKAYDIVVVGAGLGGLTAAALLARAGRKVLVVERNTSVGGAASTYKIGDLLVEAALHETSDPRPAHDPKHAVLAALGVLDAVEWVPTGAFYEVSGGPVGAPLLLPDDFAGARDVLADRFPGSRESIARVLGELEAVAHGAEPAAEHRGLSVAAVFDRAFDADEGVKCALAANLAYYHDDPRTLAWSFFAGAQGAQLASGARFIRNGSQRLSNALRRVIQQAGGEVLLKRLVQEIRLDAAGRPAGILHTARDGSDPREAASATVVGNAAPAVLAGLLPQAARAGFEAPYAAQPLSMSVFAATFGLSRPAAELGLRHYCTVLLADGMRRFDEFANAADLVPGLPGGALPPLTIANYSAIEAGLGGPPFPVAVLGADRIANWEGFAKADYEKRRADVLGAIAAALDRKFPGFADAIATKALNTAVSMCSYLNAPQGAVYGFAPLPSRDFGAVAFARNARTPVPGLYLAGAYAGAGGFNGAIAGGAAAAQAILES